MLYLNKTNEFCGDLPKSMLHGTRKQIRKPDASTAN